MKDLFVFIPIILIFLSVMLSVTAFKGGFNFGYMRFLKKFKQLNDHLINQPATEQNLETLRLLNNFLISIKVENESVVFWDWHKQSFTKDGDRL